MSSSSMAARALVLCCRASYYISLLGLKIPSALLLKASKAPLCLAWITLVWCPFLIYSHLYLLPKVQEMSHESAVRVWHLLTAVWITIPVLVVGVVILSVVRAVGPLKVFGTVLACVLGFHCLVVPLIATTTVGAVFLQLLFALFEDMPIVGWIWCLYHVVRLQMHIKTNQANRETPFAPPKGPNDRSLIIGNAPTVTEGAPLGSVIDDFNHVVRFNGYSVSKPEYTGTKVGFHFCNGRNFPTNKTVQAVCPLFYASLTHAVYLFMPHMEDAQEIFANLTSQKVDAWFIEEDAIMELRRKIGCRFWQIPTSGMVAINAFLANREKVSLHGFNFFAGKKIHYFEETATQLITSWLERFVTHDPSFEKIWVEGLCRQGRVSFLAKEHEAAEGNTENTGESDDIDVPEDKLSAEKGEKGEELRRRTPGIVHTILKDGWPSQFSL